MVRAVITSTALTGHTNFRAPTPVTASSIGVGCSGSDPIWNAGGMAYLVQQAKGATPKFDKNTIPGAPIDYHMTHAPEFGGLFAWNMLQNYEYLHIGDNPGLAGLIDPIYLNQWAQKFWSLGNGGAGGEVLLFSLQPVLSFNATTMANTIANNIIVHNRAQDYANARRPDVKRLVRQIPLLQLCKRFFEDQQAGLAPTATFFYDLYHVDPEGGQDNFHWTFGKGSYVHSAISAACMYGIDPMTLANDMQQPSGFTPAEVQYIKTCISQTIKGFARAGVDTSGWA